jgi:acetyl esterase
METMKLAGAYLFLGAEAIHFVVQQFVTFVLRRSGASPRRTRFRSMAIECKDEMMRWEAVDIPVRIYRDGATPRTAPLVLHLHGGAFVGGSLESGMMVATILADAGAIVVSAGYPLAPQCQFPKPLMASYCALEALYGARAKWASKKSGIFIAGEEAGGNLAAAVALMARDQGVPPLAGQILLSPMLDPCLATMSLREAEAGAGECRYAWGWRQYLGSADKACHPYAAPLGSSRLTGLAPVLLVTAEDDPLRDETKSYAKRLRASGVQVECHELDAPTGWPGALTAPNGNGAPWTENLRGHFVGFFKSTTSLRGEHPSHRSEKA